MNRILRTAGIVLLASSVGAAMADPPYVGKWKLNAAKSDFGQLTASYEATPDGGYKATMDGVSYTFKIDGKPVKTPWGTMAAWKAVNATTWEITGTTDGKPFSTDTVKLSADGKTMTVDSKMAQGATSSTTFTRVSGSSGLVGTWKAAKMSTGAGIVDIAAKGADGIVLKLVDMGATCEGKLDGKPNTASGSAFPAGWTCAFTKSGENGFTVAFNKDGKPMYSSTFTASADGKTLTEAGGSVNTKEKTKAVYDRQ
jgi:hypothetical protein